MEISHDAFIKRLSRHLQRDGLKLKVGRGPTASLGPYYTVDENNVVEHQKLEWDTLIEWAKEANLLKAGETIAE